MLKRKYTVQKSIRFDERLAEDLEFLANELERTQNDLVNIAVEDLMKENSYYFKKLIVVEQLIDFFNGNVDRDAVKFEGVHVTVNLCDDDSYCVKIIFTDENGNVIEQSEKKSDDIDVIYKTIIDYTNLHVDFNSDSVKKYLNKRLDYK